jgi:hypothetical protein
LINVIDTAPKLAWSSKVHKTRNQKEISKNLEINLKNLRFSEGLNSIAD